MWEVAAKVYPGFCVYAGTPELLGIKPVREAQIVGACMAFHAFHSCSTSHRISKSYFEQLCIAHLQGTLMASRSAVRQ
eukprot:10884187-Karenia_brevis.AAC.1